MNVKQYTKILSNIKSGTISEEEFINIFGTDSQIKSYYENNKKFLSKSPKKTIFSIAKIFCNISYNQKRNIYIIRNIYTQEHILNKLKKSYRQFTFVGMLNMDFDCWNKKGVYIIRDNPETQIYVGSTYISFYNRFCEHYVSENYMNTKTYNALHNGCTMQLLWLAPENATEDEVRQKEIEYIHYYESYCKSKNIAFLNSKNTTNGKRKKNKYYVKFSFDNIHDFLKFIKLTILNSYDPIVNNETQKILEEHGVHIKKGTT